MNQEQVIKDTQINSKLSKDFYRRLDADIKLLKEIVSEESIRCISFTLNYLEIARGIKDMSSIDYNNIVTISRAGGHKI